MDTVQLTKPDSEPATARGAESSTRALWQPLLTAAEAARAWGDEGSAARAGFERVIAALACMTPDEMMADVSANQDEARHVAAVCTMLATHYRIAYDVALAVRERLTWALDMHKPRKDGDAVN